MRKYYTHYLNIRFPSRDSIVSKYPDEWCSETFPKESLTRFKLNITTWVKETQNIPITHAVHKKISGNHNANCIISYIQHSPSLQSLTAALNSLSRSSSGLTGTTHLGRPSWSSNRLRWSNGKSILLGLACIGMSVFWFDESGSGWGP